VYNELEDLESEYGDDSPYIESPLVHEALAMKFSATSTKASRKMQQRLATPDSGNNGNNENDSSSNINHTPVAATPPGKRREDGNGTLQTPSLQSPLAVSR
jgi:hypothetical protein